MKKVNLLIVLCFFMTLGAFAADEDTAKLKSIEEYRLYYSEHKFRGHELKPDKSLSESLSLLQADGKFSDLVSAQDEILASKSHLSSYSAAQGKVSELNKKAYNRLWQIAESYRGNNTSGRLTNPTVQKLLKGFINYGELELSRANVSGGRFHTSCFAIPTAAVNSYFSLFELMDKIDDGAVTDELAVKANSVLTQVGMQSWTQPYRNDYTDLNVVQVDRFRKHVWWVGGNGLAYRSVLPVSFMMSSVEMVDVLAEVAKGAMSYVSQNTYDEAFWTEGFTADGAGWGHGMQCLIWGYPVHGTSAALGIMNTLKGSPWAGELEKDNLDALFNFFRGSSWYYFQGYIPPCVDRGSMAFSATSSKTIGSANLAGDILNKWEHTLSSAQSVELNKFITDANNKKFVMGQSTPGYYTGTRWFFNNDDLIKKTSSYYTMVNMASIRCDGLESAIDMADEYNFYTCDGMTLFEKSGNEYHYAIGGWNLTSIPGVTSRQGEDKLTPLTHWSGYCSKHNFAAAATSGSVNAAAGFIFEKIDAKKKNDLNNAMSTTTNEILYGVKAYKSYFMFNDYMLAMGAGIANNRSENSGDVWTTIEQTLWQGDVEYNSPDQSGQVSLGGDAQNIQLKASDATSAEFIWAKQENGFSYAVMPQETTGSVHLNVEQRNTKWDKLNSSNKGKSNVPEKVNVFHLWINHGKDVSNGKYAYLVYNGITDAERSFTENPVNILSNTTSLQAAETKKGDIAGAVFYNPATELETSTWKMKVSHPCAVLVELNNDVCEITVTDAKMNKDLDAITIRTSLPIMGSEVTKEGDWFVTKIPMPQGALCGKPSTKSFQLDVGGIPWRESFSFDNGVEEDTEGTPWSIQVSNVLTGGYALVKDETFTVKGANCTWTSGSIDISKEKAVDISAELTSLRGTRFDENDGVKCYYILDDNDSVLFYSETGNIESDTILASNITGDRLVIVVEIINGNARASYILDNVWVTRYSVDRESSLAEIKVNGELLDGFRPDRLSYDLKVTEMPQITAKATSEKAGIEVIMPEDINGTVKIRVTAEDGSYSSYSILLSSSVNLQSLCSENILLYPNPGKGILNAKGLEKISSISLSTMDGKVILSKKVEGNKIALDTSRLLNGMYLVVFHKETGISDVKKAMVNN